MARPNDFICTAKTCYNSKVTHPSMGFFSFPSDAENCKIWLENCQRTDLSVENVVKLCDLYKLCSDHFEQKYFSDCGKRFFLHKTTNLNPIPTIFTGKSLELPSMDNFHDENTSLDIPEKHMNAALEEEDLVREFECDFVPTELLVKCHQPSVSFNDVQLSKRSDEERDTVVEAVSHLEPTTELHPIETLCRLCMNITSGDFVEIFSNTAEAKEIRRLFQIVLPERVLIGDGLPQRICHLCIPDLKTCGTLMEKFKKSDLYLRQIEKYSLFVEDSETVEDCNTLSDKDFIKPVSKKGLVIPLHRFKTHNAVVQKSLEILNGKNVNKSARISQKTPPSQDEIKLVCVNILKSKEGENSQERPSKQLGSRTLVEDRIYAKKDVNNVLNNEEMSSVMSLDEDEDITQEDEENLNPDSFRNDCPKEIIDRSNLDPSARLLYKCLECREVLDNYPALVDHVFTLHRQERRVKQSGVQNRASKKVRCKQCDPIKPALFDSKAELEEHVGQQHTNQCSTCARVFTSVVRLRNHEARHRDDPQCTKCGLVFKSGWQRRQHEASHSSEQSRICEICGVLLPTNRTFESHMKKHTMYSCEICGKQLRSYKSYLCHKQYHSKHHRCALCHRRFATAGSFERHKMLHATKGNSYRWPTVSSVCEFCGAKFKSKTSIKRHLMARENCGFCPRLMPLKGKKVMQQDEETQHKCNTCGKTYVNFKNLQKHRRIHYNEGDPAAIQELQQYEETKHKCDICGKRFVKIKNMQNHRRLHFCSGDPAAIQVLLEEPEIHVCQVCKKTFYGRLVLQKHSQKHIEMTNPYDCVVCGKTFTSQRNYLVHERSEHTNDQPFKCSHCGKKFCMQYLMKHHIKISHKRKTRFSRAEGLHVCTNCNMKFKTRIAAWKHFNATHGGSKVTHEGETYVCKICNKEFKSPYYLRHHSLSHKGERCACPLCGTELKHKGRLAHHIWRMHKKPQGGRKIDSAKEEGVEKYSEYDVEEVDQDNENDETINAEKEHDFEEVDQYIENSEEENVMKKTIQEEIVNTQVTDFEIKGGDGTQTRQMMLEESKEAIQYIILSNEQEIEYIIS